MLRKVSAANSFEIMSVRLKSRNQCAIGGFFFRQPEISHEQMQDWSFDALVNRVIELRRANPRFNLSIDKTTVTNAVDEYTASYMLTLRGGENYVMQDSLPSPPSFSQPQASRPNSAAVVGKAARASVGVKVLLDWLGSGLVPVDLPLAESRAATCVACPMNKQGDFFQRIEASVARRIKNTIELKNSMSLKTTQEDKLFTCQACDCWMPLKVWTPLKHIIETDTPEHRTQLDPKCWILSETKNQTSP